MTENRILKALLIDNEQEALDLLENLLVATEKVTVVCTLNNPLELSEQICSHKPDIIFMDIKMGKYNGIETIEVINPFIREIPVVFVTAHDEYAIKAIKLKAFDYLKKPVCREELLSTIERAILEKEGKTDVVEKIKIPYKGRLFYIDLSEIACFEAQGNYTHISCVDNQTFISSYNLGKYEEQIDKALFTRIGRHAIINKKLVYKVDKKHNVLTLKKDNWEKTIKYSISYWSNIEI